MSIEISSNGLEYGTVSSGEMGRITIALTFAFRDAWESLSGIKTNLLMIDEMIDDIIDLIASNFKGEETADWISWWLWEVDLEAPEEKRVNHVWIKNEDEGVSYKYTILDLDDLYYLISGEESKIKTKVKEEPPEIGSLNNMFHATNDEEGQTLYEEFLNTVFPKKEDLN